MPSYIVLQQGFYGGVMYDPRGKRKVLTTDVEFTKGNCPSWVKFTQGDGTKKETAAAKKLAEQVAKKEAAATKKLAEQVAKGNEDVNAATFIGDGVLPGATTTTIENLG